jgi:glycosyltransferase involved in cell wall biosynthesis
VTQDVSLITTGVATSKMGSAPLISIITIIYNDVQHVEETIKSVIQQSLKNIEYVVIDGGSTDGTVDVIKKYNKGIDSWISEPDEGIYDAMNKGIFASTGDWIIFVNSGDYFVHSEVLSAIDSFLRSQVEDILSGLVKVVDERGKWLGYRHPYKSSINSQIKNGNTIAHQATFVRRAVFEKIGVFNTKYKIQGDYDFWLRCFDAGVGIKRISNDICCFRIAGLSSSREAYRNSIKEKYAALISNSYISRTQGQAGFLKEIMSFRFKSYLRIVLGRKISERISVYNLRRISSDLKIVFDLSISGATRAGVHVFASQIVEALQRNPNSFVLVKYKNPFSTLGKTGLARKLSSIARLLFAELIVFRGRQNDIFFFPAPEVPLLVLIMNRRFIVVLHDIYSWKNPGTTTVFTRIKNKLLPYIARKAEQIGTVSEFSKEDISSHFLVEPEKIFVVANGVSETVIDTSHTSEIPCLLGKSFMFNVGSIEPRKNIGFLIDVFEHTKRTGKVADLKLVLTGGESWNNELIRCRLESSEFHDEIIVLGFVTEQQLYWLYRNGKVMVFPSKEEGFGIPVIECLSQGTPVVINRNSGLSQFCNFGAIGLSDFDIETWSRLVISIIYDSRGVSAVHINSIKNHFNWDSSAKSIIEKLSQ